MGLGVRWVLGEDAWVGEGGMGGYGSRVWERGVGEEDVCVGCRMKCAFEGREEDRGSIGKGRTTRNGKCKEKRKRKRQARNMTKEKQNKKRGETKPK